MGTPKITAIKTTAVRGVYSGTNGKCCCGCAGVHSCDPVRIAQTVRYMNRKLATNFDGCASGHVAIVVGKRVHIAYFED